MKSKQILAVLVVILMGVGWWSYRRTSQIIAASPGILAPLGKAFAPDNWPPEVGKPYPDIEMTDQTGQTVKLSQFKGKIIVVEPISMDCTACQAWTGAHEVGAVGSVHPQANLESWHKYFPLYGGGVSFDDPRFVFVQLLYFNLSRQPTVPADAKLWADHFKLDRAKNRIVLAGSARYRTPAWDAGTYRQVPGLQIIDQNFILRSDATGHPPKDDLYQVTLPLIGQMVQRLAPAGLVPNKKYFLEDGSVFMAPSGRRYTVDNPLLGWFRTLYEKRDYAAIHAHYQALLQQGTPKGHTQLSIFYTGLVDTSRLSSFEKTEEILSDWIQKSPRQETPWMLRGMLYYNWAWFIRGGGFVSEVDPNAFEPFERRMLQAKADFEKAAELEPRDPNPWARLIHSAKVLSLGRDIMEGYFQNAIKRFPGHVAAHYEKWHYLLPRWFGKAGEAEAFENEVRAKLARYPRLGIILIDAHQGKNSEDKDKKYLQQPQVWHEIQAYYEAVLREDPKNWAVRADYAWIAWFAKDMATAKAQFDAVGDRFPVQSEWAPDDYDRWRGLTDQNGAKARVHFGGKEL